MLTVIFFLSATLYAFFTVRTLLCLKWAQRLPSAKSSGTHPLPRCSVIFAARDEGARVEQTLRRILALQGVDFEVIPVDDRSRDETSQILKRISAEDPRVKPKRVDVLPENWLGKCHACHVGAQSASGEWLLFTDADCWLKPDVLSRALVIAEAEKVEHVTLTPGVAVSTLPAEGCQICFLLSVVDWIANVNQDKPRAHLGVGAFNLVRRDTYRKFGGHETLRLTVVDDVKLGRLVRNSGGRTRAFIGSDDVECHWGVTVRNFIKLMEKNYFAALNYSITAGLLVGILMPILWIAAIYGPFSGTFLGWTAGLAALSMIVPGVIIALRVGWPIRGALMTPFVFPVLYYAILKSMVLTLYRGGVRWRDTFYPLDLLRKGNVR